MRDVMGQEVDDDRVRRRSSFSKSRLAAPVRSGNASELDVLMVAFKNMPAEADLDGKDGY